MAERSIYKKGEIKSRNDRELKNKKPEQQRTKRANHKHEYTKVILVYKNKIPGFGERTEGHVADICLVCNRVRHLSFREMEKIPGEKSSRMLSVNPEDVETRHPELPVFECEQVDFMKFTNVRHRMWG